MAHSRLSPSSAVRWIACPGSVNASAPFERTESAAAAEGTLAHEVAASLLLTDEFPVGLNVSTEMGTYVIGYVERCWKHCYDLKREEDFCTTLVETKLDLSATLGPGEFGTADFIAMGAETLVVRDLKYGKGVAVDAGTEEEPNPQAVLYAIGALQIARTIGVEPKRILIEIDQPRLETVSSLCLPVAAVDDLQLVYAKAAGLTRRDDAPLVPGAKQCMFCPAKRTCKARADWIQGFARAEANIIDNDYLAKALSVVDEMAAWIKDVKELAHDRLMDGQSIPGFKLVEGVGRRQWTADAAKHLEPVIGDKMWAEPSLIGITEAEKKLKQAGALAIMELATEKKVGSPIVAPESDRRPAVGGRPKACDEFTDEGTT